MSGILGIVLPVFALVLAGYIGGRARWLSEEGVKGLSSFVFYLAIPALLFRTLARGEIPESLDSTSSSPISPAPFWSWAWPGRRAGWSSPTAPGSWR